jgi:hypothetical protein
VQAVANLTNVMERVQTAGSYVSYITPAIQPVMQGILDRKFDIPRLCN